MAFSKRNFRIACDSPWGACEVLTRCGSSRVDQARVSGVS